MTRDESVYPDPETFNPARWLSPKYPTYREPLTTHPNLDGYSQFGFGRRTCQGIPVVDQDLFLTMGGMAWAFDVRRRRDGVSGREVPVPWNDFTPLLIAKPAPFVFDLVARDEGKVVAMREMFDEAGGGEEGWKGQGKGDGGVGLGVGYAVGCDVGVEREPLLEMTSVLQSVVGGGDEKVGVVPGAWA